MDATGISISRQPAYDIEFLKNLYRAFTIEHPDGRMLLFGSRARGNNRYHSDYDILFLSGDFATMKASERYLQIMGKVRPVNCEWALQPHCYTPGEWNNLRGTLFFEEVENTAKEINLEIQ